MQPEAIEDFLARIYVDAEARQRFQADPSAELAKAGLSGQVDPATIDWTGLELAAASFARKRAGKRPRTWLQRWLARSGAVHH